MLAELTLESSSMFAQVLVMGSTLGRAEERTSSLREKPTFVLALVGTVLVAAIASGCGGPSAAEKAANAMAATRAAHLAAYRKCKTQTGPFLTVLQDLNSRLDVGLSFNAYSDRVGNVKVAYDALPISAMGPACVSKVGVPAEAALNAYLKAYNTWNDCFNDDYCSTDSIDPELQDSWVTATGKIAIARTGLGQIRAVGASS